MPFTVVVGCQWGDEGKGKIVDLLAGEADWVARFQGGANAGHTVMHKGKPAVLHLLPTGILRPQVRCVIGNGVVLDPIGLVEELLLLEKLGVAWRGRLFISAGAHLVTPLHREIEAFRQQDTSIGTTRRGIGPAYEDKASRRGIRALDLIDRDGFRDSLRSQWETYREMRGGAVGETSLDDLLALLEEPRSLLAPLVCDVTDLLLAEDDAGKRILCEGAQGALLDIDHGTYPFVTSSNTTVGGACTGLGIPPRRIGRVVGVVKAYATRVGLGPFPTEFGGPEADRFRERAGEFGATTGRPRRCGWFDAVLARRGVRINGVDELVVTKVDVLAGTTPLRMATAYRRAERIPPGQEGGDPEAPSRSPLAWLSAHGLEAAEVEYVELPGWDEDPSQARSWEALPRKAKAYLERLVDETGARLTLASVGPGRDQVVSCREMKRP